MKRLLVVLLSLAYLAAGSGFTLRQHFCMGQLIGTAIDHPANNSDSHQCTRCGMEKKSNDDKSCCKDKVKLFKASPDQLPAKAQAPVIAALAILPVSFNLPPATHITSLPRITAAPAHGPPGRTALPIYLQVRCLRV